MLGEETKESQTGTPGMCTLLYGQTFAIRPCLNFTAALKEG